MCTVYITLVVYCSTLFDCSRTEDLVYVLSQDQMISLSMLSQGLAVTFGL